MATARAASICRSAPTARATALGAPNWGTPEDERETFVPPPVERVR